MNERDKLTEKLAGGKLQELFTLAAQESLREDPRPYIAERIMRRVQKRIAKRLYELPLEESPRKGETVDKYIRRLYDIALASDAKGS